MMPDAGILEHATRAQAIFARGAGYTYRGLQKNLTKYWPRKK